MIFTAGSFQGKVLCDIDFKRGITAFVMEYRFIIYVNLCFIIDCAEMQDQTVILWKSAGGIRQKGVIPEIFVRFQLSFHTGERTFWGKGNENLSIISCNRRIM